jgi:hypothetical protein
MSIKVMTYVWQYSKAKSGDLLVQLALADFSNDEGVAFPAIQTLGRKTRLSLRQVKRVLGRLQRLGELTILRKQGPHGVNVYKVITGNEGDKLAPRKTYQSDILGKKVVTWASPNPIRKPSLREERSGGPVSSVHEGDNSVVDKDDHGEVDTVGEGAKNLMAPIGNPLKFLSTGLRESFLKHFEDDPS